MCIVLKKVQRCIVTTEVTVELYKKVLKKYFYLKITKPDKIQPCGIPLKNEMFALSVTLHIIASSQTHIDT